MAPKVAERSTFTGRAAAVVLMMTYMAGPLSGYRIIELAGIGPGPFAAMMLADMGAEVIRVERAKAVNGPAPDRPHYDVLLRGRRNIAIDLKHPEGAADIARSGRVGRRA